MLSFIESKSKFSQLQAVASIMCWADTRSKASELITTFVLRNEPKVVTPFLDALNISRVVIDQTVLIKDDKVEEILLKLGFGLDTDVLPKTKEYGNLFKKVPTVRMYKREYNLEFYLIKPKYWSVVETAMVLTKDLQVHKDKILVTFIKLYESLIRLMSEKVSE